jgi:peptidoglycan biosynthesis protein MviN/MurJ (putative lipid II flippase)
LLLSVVLIVLSIVIIGAGFVVACHYATGALPLDQKIISSGVSILLPELGIIGMVVVLYQLGNKK